MLAPDQIVGIIKACAEHGVHSIKFGNFEMQIGPKANLGATTVVVEPPSTPEKSSVAEMTAKQHAEQNAKSIEEIEISMREQQIAELLVTDPLAAERLIESGELHDVDDESGDDE